MKPKITYDELRQISNEAFFKLQEKKKEKEEQEKILQENYINEHWKSNVSDIEDQMIQTAKNGEYQVKSKRVYAYNIGTAIALATKIIEELKKMYPECTFQLDRTLNTEICIDISWGGNEY